MDTSSIFALIETLDFYHFVCNRVLFVRVLYCNNVVNIRKTEERIQAVSSCLIC